LQKITKEWFNQRKKKIKTQVHYWTDNEEGGKQKTDEKKTAKAFPQERVNVQAARLGKQTLGRKPILR